MSRQSRNSMALHQPAAHPKSGPRRRPNGYRIACEVPTILAKRLTSIAVRDSRYDHRVHCETSTLARTFATPAREHRDWSAMALVDRTR